MELDFDQLQEVINEYLTVYCIDDGQNKTYIKEKGQLYTKLLTFLNGKPFNLETVKEFIHYLYDNGWDEEGSKNTLGVRIRALVNYCYEEKDLFVKNWAKKIPKPTVHRKVIEVVKESVAMQIIIAGTTPKSYENSRDRFSKAETRLACEFMLNTGCRVQEVAMMKGSDLRLDADEPYVIIHSKGGDTEMQPVPEIMMPILRERVGNNRLFFFTQKGANRALERGSKDLGITTIHTTCHRLRDIFALTRLRNGVSLQLVSRALRHKSIKTTDRYYSNYVLIDIAPVINNSDLVRQKMTPQELLEELVKLVKKTGLDKHEEFFLQTTMSNEEVHIDAVFNHSKQNLSEKKE
ncbi:MAG: site-specific integrase [Patescibacteria group bacterium]